MRPTDLAVPFGLAAIALTGAVSGAAPARAAEPRDFAIPAGPLDQGIRLLARQGGVDIGSAEPGLAAVAAPAVRMRGAARAALALLLRGTGFTAVAVYGGSYRIVRRHAAVAHLSAAPVAVPPARPRRPARAVAPPTDAEIVVTASKVRTSLLRYPGSAAILDRGGMARLGSRATPGFSEAAAVLPIIQTTGQGAGRDKVFVRAVADSSFVGPTQSTATIYFGDVQLGYNGPDPNLSLYDVGRVEVLEGPQGTLYGGGAIGGVVRLEPRAPALDRAAGQVAAGASLTRSGDPGYDMAGMVNLPLVPDTVGLRAVAYRAVDGGYIDDVRRGLANVNDTTTTGGRVAVRAVTDGWTWDTGLVGQRIHAGDLQYAQRGLPGLARAARIAQPFTQKYLLARMVTSRDWDSGLRLLVASGLVRQDSRDRFDATRPNPAANPIAYDVRDHSRLLTQEVRLSRPVGSVRWLAGVSLLRANDRYTRTLGRLDQPRDISGVANRASLFAIFGEATADVSARLSVTLGGRATRARIDGDPISTGRPGPFLHGRTSERIDPTVAASWLVGPGLAAFARFHSGFRTGGIAVAPGIGRIANFDADTLRVTEVGLRKVRVGPRGFAGSAALSVADWSRVQADLIGRSGFPYTANIGSALIHGLELTGDWVPQPGVRLTAAAFLNDGRIRDPAPGLAATRGSGLPMAPALSSSAGIAYQWHDAGHSWTIDAALRQVGRSRLGTQPPLNLSQRGYTGLGVGAAMTWAHGPELTLRVENLLDARGDRYASGNPFGILARDQYTPLRPRTVRFGISLPLNRPDDAPG